MRYPLPTESEIRELVERAAEKAARSRRPDRFGGDTFQLVDMLKGLPANAITNLLSQAIIRAGEFGPAIYQCVLEEKKAMFERMCGGVAEFVPPPAPFKMAGYSNVKRLVARLKQAWAQHNLRVPIPRGVLLLGGPGTGKTQLAYFAAAELQIPLIILSMGALQSGTVGSGQANLKLVLDAVGAIGRCILLLDELIKETDTTENAKRGGGTSEHLRTLANLMTWMESRKPGVIVMATGNTGDLRSGLPEGLLERFPYAYLVDKPRLSQRAQIWGIHLEARGHEPDEFDPERLAAESDGLVGRDIRNLVEEAEGIAFEFGAPLAQEHILAAIEFVREHKHEVGGYTLIPADEEDAPLSQAGGYESVELGFVEQTA